MWAFLVLFSIAKLFFTEAFILCMSNQKIITIGEWIDAHILVEQVILFVTSYFTYFFYLCACKQVWNLTVKEHAVVFVVNTVLSVLSYFAPDFGFTFDIAFMILLPCVFKATYTQFTTIFVAHYIGQCLLLLIRSKPLLLLGVDFATQFLLSADAYLWLALYYAYSNKYKETPLWEEFALRFSEISQKISLKLSSRKSDPK